MNLDSVVSGNAQYPIVLSKLLERFDVDSIYEIRLSDICEGDYNKRSGYASSTYTGSLKKDIEISELELAMICDNGYSFFGGKSFINEDRSFVVEVWID